MLPYPSNPNCPVGNDEQLAHKREGTLREIIIEVPSLVGLFLRL